MDRTENILIGLAGAARSGKDTAAQFLQTCFGLEVMSFASPIKGALSQLLGLDERHLNGELKEAPLPELGGRTPRYLMQTLGTDWGRDTVFRDIWVRAAAVALERARAARHERGLFWYGAVFADVRFENEARWIRDRGGAVIHILREDAPPVEPHKSEHGINPWYCDFVVRNNGTIDELEQRVAGIVLARWGDFGQTASGDA